MFETQVDTARFGEQGPNFLLDANVIGSITDFESVREGSNPSHPTNLRVVGQVLRKKIAIALSKEKDPFALVGTTFISVRMSSNR